MTDCILIGAPVDCGKRRRGCLMGPDAYRTAGLVEALEALGHHVTDIGNVAPDRGGWVGFRVVDDRGRDAIGATVTMRVGDRRLRRDVRTAYSYCAANDHRVHVGLGDHARVDDVVVRWPDGARESLGPQDADRVIRVGRE